MAEALLRIDPHRRLNYQFAMDTPQARRLEGDIAAWIE